MENDISSQYVVSGYTDLCIDFVEECKTFTEAIELLRYEYRHGSNVWIHRIKNGKADINSCKWQSRVIF